MSLSFLTPSRTILMISDDALFIHSISSKGVSLVEAVPWGVGNFLEDVSSIIAKDCSSKPVLILNDMVEQHYRKEIVPNVGVLDKQNVLKRRLKVAFPNYPVRAALPLKQKQSKTDKTLGGQTYVFAAVPASEPFSKTMESAKMSLANIAGFCLLPVEASDMIGKLSTKLSAQSGVKPKWTVFIGQHQSGGLRQVVIKDGELALTRMTPVCEHDEDPVAWANEVHQEFQATMSYLSRFGYSSDDRLNVIVIAPSATGDIVNELIDVPCEFNALTVSAAANILGLNVGMHDAEHYADVLHIAWIGRKSRFILPMKAREIDNVSKPRQIAVLASVFLLLGGAFQGYQLLDYYQALVETKDEVESSSNQYSQLTLQYKKELERKKDMGFDIQLIHSSLGVYDDLEKRQVRALPLFYKIGIALGRDLRIDSVQILRQARVQQSTGGRGRFNRDKPAVKPLFISTLQMTFPSTTNAEKGNVEVQEFRTRLQRLLPGHVVVITKLLEDYEYSEEIVVESGRSDKAAKAQDYVAELKIEGPMIE